LAVGSNLGDTGRRTIGSLVTVILGAHELDVLVVAAGKAIADSVTDSSDTTRVGLAITTRKEEMHICACISLLEPDDRRGDGQWKKESR